MSVLPLTEAFSGYLTDERHFSPYTARCYGADLRQYVEFLSDEHGIEISTDAERAAFEKRRNAAQSAPGEVVASIEPTTLTGHILEADADKISAAIRAVAKRTSGTSGGIKILSKLYYNDSHARA